MQFGMVLRTPELRVAWCPRPCRGQRTEELACGRMARLKCSFGFSRDLTKCNGSRIKQNSQPYKWEFLETIWLGGIEGQGELEPADPAMSSLANCAQISEREEGAVWTPGKGSPGVSNPSVLTGLPSDSLLKA